MRELIAELRPSGGALRLVRGGARLASTSMRGSRHPHLRLLRR